MARKKKQTVVVLKAQNANASCKHINGSRTGIFLNSDKMAKARKTDQETLQVLLGLQTCCECKKEGAAMIGIPREDNSDKTANAHLLNHYCWDCALSCGIVEQDSVSWFIAEMNRLLNPPPPKKQRRVKTEPIGVRAW